jgi:hypothetical protein
VALTHFEVRVEVVVGGIDSDPQACSLSQMPHIIISTPGRYEEDDAGERAVHVYYFIVILVNLPSFSRFHSHAASSTLCGPRRF